MPRKGLKKDVEEFTDCLAHLTEIYEKYSHTHIVVIGVILMKSWIPRKDQRESAAWKSLFGATRSQGEKIGKTFINSLALSIFSSTLIVLMKR